MTPERRIERLRQFSTGERGPYDGIADDMVALLTVVDVDVIDLAKRFEARAKHCRWREATERQLGMKHALYWQGRAEAWEIAALNMRQSNDPI